jgi:hypothetical protein
MPATGMPLPFFSYRRNSIIYLAMWDGSFTKYFTCRSERGLGRSLKFIFEENFSRANKVMNLKF